MNLDIVKLDNIEAAEFSGEDVFILSLDLAVLGFVVGTIIT